MILVSPLFLAMRMLSLSVVASVVGTEAFPMFFDEVIIGTPSEFLMIVPQAAEEEVTEPSKFTLKVDAVGGCHLMADGGCHHLIH